MESVSVRIIIVRCLCHIIYTNIKKEKESININILIK